MDTAVQVFENREFGQVRIKDIHGENWFVLADILRAIDTSTPPHVAKASLSEVFGDGGIAVTPIPDALGRIQESTIISEPAMTYLVAQSRTETAKKLNRWIHGDILPSIRRTGAYQIPRNEHPLKILIQQDFWAAECVADMLRVSDDSRLALCYAIYDHHGLDKSVLPQYTEAPRQRMSASALLKKHNVDMSTIKFNQLMVNNGMLEERERTGASGAVRKFKNLTDLGLAFGENMVSPQNPRETHPMYYEDAFEDLLMTLTMGKSQEP
ncbi:BRO-N domain-containing protein [Desulfobotulus mexicanus]|uniref:Bro-N domain-containing protein n=1 Tax=Desulfobotulus mexicanus TaxID=2586642 RepID=A0A5S5MBR8_9BACT|nr:BRO family protein [Desulfobotulus mexicanus]TYT73163.1 hypothetical protein FIM25_16565 [Desulfobotulus mexicanus]